MTKLKFAKTDIGFKELKGEISLLVEVTNCQNNCKGCHSPHLQQDSGRLLGDLIYSIIDTYTQYITAVCFLGHGGKEQKSEFVEILSTIRKEYPHLKLGLYSGNDTYDTDYVKNLDYYKVGRYIEERGGLESPTTNQCMYNLMNGIVVGTTKFYDDPKETPDRINYQNGGVKETAIDGKPKTMFQLIEPKYIEGIGDVLTMGALKYSANNWKKVDRSEYERAMYHHMNEYLKGNKLDEDSGQPHLYHLATNVMFLDWFDRN